MCQTIKKERKTKSAEQALQSLMALCARAEKSSGDAFRLMRSWGVEESIQHSILRQLQKDSFIDDRRFATAFVREKTNLNGWGSYKIRIALGRKGIAKEIIDEELSQLDPESTQERLATLLAKRARTTKYKTRYQLRDKLIRYGASLGYDFERVNDCVRELLAQLPNEEEEEIFQDIF